MWTFNGRLALLVAPVSVWVEAVLKSLSETPNLWPDFPLGTRARQAIKYPSCQASRCKSGIEALEPQVEERGVQDAELRASSQGENSSVHVAIVTHWARRNVTPLPGVHFERRLGGPVSRLPHHTELRFVPHSTTPQVPD